MFDVMIVSWTHLEVIPNYTTLYNEDLMNEYGIKIVGIQEKN